MPLNFLFQSGGGGGGGGGEANTAANVGGGDGIYKNKTGANLNFKTLKAGSNVTLTPSADEILIASAGGSAYPQQIQLVTADKTLSPADQGIIYQAGGILTLPAAAENGTSYLIVGATNDLMIDTSSAVVIGLGIGTYAAPLRPSRFVNLVAFNAPSLMWMNAETESLGTWENYYTYSKGCLVLYDDAVYISLKDNNLNNATSNVTHWRRLSS